MIISYLLYQIPFEIKLNITGWQQIKLYALSYLETLHKNNKNSLCKKKKTLSWISHGIKFLDNRYVNK